METHNNDGRVKFFPALQCNKVRTAKTGSLREKRLRKQRKDRKFYFEFDYVSFIPLISQTNLTASVLNQSAIGDFNVLPTSVGIPLVTQESLELTGSSLLKSETDICQSFDADIFFNSTTFVNKTTSTKNIIPDFAVSSTLTESFLSIYNRAFAFLLTNSLHNRVTDFTRCI